jgi:hypothetical protein
MSWPLRLIAAIPGLGFVTSLAHAENLEPSRSVAILVNPVAAVLGIANLDIGIGVAPGVSLDVMPQYVSIADVSGFGINAGLQLFPGGGLYDGWFLHPQGGYASFSADDSDATGSNWTVGMIAGYHWSWELLSLRLGVGAAYHSFYGDGPEFDDVEFSGVRPALDISIGSAF